MAEAKPYSVNLPRVKQEDLPEVLPRLFEAIDQMLVRLYQLAGSSTGSGLTSIVNDTNVTATLSGTTLTLGWNGVLAPSRGGYSNAKVYARMSLRA